MNDKRNEMRERMFAHFAKRTVFSRLEIKESISAAYWLDLFLEWHESEVNRREAELTAPWETGSDLQLSEVKLRSVGQTDHVGGYLSGESMRALATELDRLRAALRLANERAERAEAELASRQG